MRKHMYLLIALMTISLFTTPTFANTNQEASKNESNMFVDGKQVWGTGFNVGGSNYFKLRDIANDLSQTTSQFAVTWNSEKGLIEIITGESYTHVDDDKTWYHTGEKYSGILKNESILVDGKEYSLPVFNIDGSNYFKLRDLSELIHFDMEWDKEKDEISLFSRMLENTYRVETAYDQKENNVYPSYPRWSQTVSTYLTDNKDGTISVIEAKKDITIETYDDQYNLIEKNSIPYELPLFGGFYSGEKHNYIAFGEANTEENDSKEVIRIVRYDKKFKRLDSVSVKGGESFTTIPFEAAAGRMAEDGDKLVFHTSRQRYKTSDGLNHQSQLTIIVDTSAMKVLNDLGRFQSNHVSHSFDQYVLFDNNTHVLLDHGDAYPRSIYLSKESGDAYNGVDLFEIPGTIGANYTGVSIGGFEDSSTNYIVAMNTIDHSVVKEYTSYEMVGLEKDERDIIITTVAKDNLSNSAVKQTTLKKYIGTDKMSSIPHLIKISDEKLMVMWQEYDKDNNIGDLKYVLIDGQGNPIGEIETVKNFRASAVQPIVVGNKVVWHLNTNGTRTFYSISL